MTICTANNHLAAYQAPFPKITVYLHAVTYIRSVGHVNSITIKISNENELVTDRQ